MPNSQIVLQAQTLPDFQESEFLHSLNAIDNFFGSIDTALKELEDDSLVDLITTIDALGQRAWFTRCLIVAEIETRVKDRLGLPALSSSQFEEHVAQAVNLSKSTAYEDMALVRAIRARGVEPRLDRTFYRIALRSQDFNNAAEHAEEEYDRYQGKYSTREFARWVEVQRNGQAEEVAVTSIQFNKEEINYLLDAVQEAGWIREETIEKLRQAKKRLSK